MFGAITEIELCQVSSALNHYALTFLPGLQLYNLFNWRFKYYRDPTLDFNIPSTSLSSTTTEFKCFTVFHILRFETTDG